MSQRLPILITLLCLPLATVATETKSPDGEASPPAAVQQVKRPAQCELATGSRIRPKLSQGCDTPKPYRTFTAEELERTGEINLIEALRKLDPIFR